MNPFQSTREAKEYLVNRIVVEANRDGIPLSDLERKMLYFSEAAWTLPDMMAINNEFELTYDQREYESKIGRIVHRIHARSATSDNRWNEAVERLRSEDHYLLVLIDGASSEPAKLSPGELARLILAAVIAIVVFLPILEFVNSHVTNRDLSRLISDAALIAIIAIVWFVANRRRRIRTKHSNH